MLTRTVRAETMLEALEQIRTEMGSDALIVSARQVPGGPSWQVWKKTMVEVVAVKPDKPETDTDTSSGKNDSQGQEQLPERKTAKKKVSAAGNNETSRPLPSEKKAAPNPAPVEEKPADEIIEDTSPVHVKVRRAVFPELKKQKPAVTAPQKVEPKDSPVETSPVEIMEQLGILGQEAETRPEIDMSFTEQIAPPSDSEEKLEVISQAPENGLLSIEKFSDLITPRSNARPEDMWPLLAKLHRQLKEQGLDEEILGKITEVSLEMVSSKGMNDEKRIRESLARQLEAYIHVQKDNGSTRQIICLVGASGSGKTSLCAKLAVKYHNSLKKRVAWISADTIRTGAINEARVYSDAIGVTLHTVYTPEELYEAAAREKTSDVILVDMPAINPRSEASVVELGSYLTMLQRRNTWIVVPATAKTSDMVNLAATLSPFRPTAIALTKLDETGTFGSAFNLAWKTQMPLVYFSYGPRVMDELVNARADTLVRAMFTERFDG